VAKRLLQYSAADNAGSRAIRYWSAGSFSHVDWMRPDGTLLGARTDFPVNGETGVQIRPNAYEKWSATAIVELDLTDEQSTAFDAFEQAQIGKPYDGRSIIGYVLPIVSPARKESWRAPDAWFCSELVQAALEASRWMPRIYFPLNRVTPIASYQMVMAKGARLVRTYGV
jgi:hypothetical protein